MRKTNKPRRTPAARNVVGQTEKRLLTLTRSLTKLHVQIARWPGTEAPEAVGVASHQADEALGWLVKLTSTVATLADMKWQPPAESRELQPGSRIWIKERFRGDFMADFTVDQLDRLVVGRLADRNRVLVRVGHTGDDAQSIGYVNRRALTTKDPMPNRANVTVGGNVVGQPGAKAPRTRRPAHNPIHNGQQPE